MLVKCIRLGLGARRRHRKPRPPIAAAQCACAARPGQRSPRYANGIPAIVLSAAVAATITAALARADQSVAVGAVERERQFDAQRAESSGLRMRLDATRHRLWVLTLDHVVVYDMRSWLPIHSIPLPDWSVAAFVCPPDLALDRAGTAVVSSNVQPLVFQIDIDRWRTAEHRLALVSARQAEVGFGALAFGSDGTLFALSAGDRTLWRLDLDAGAAVEAAAHVATQGCELDTPG